MDTIDEVSSSLTFQDKIQLGKADHLHLKIIKGKLIRNTEAFGKMDPYCVIEYNGMKMVKTSV